MLYVIIIGFVLLLGLFIFLRKEGGGSFPWIRFYVKGRESGFNFKEVNLLRKVAVENRLENPTSLFWSIKQLDRSIKGMMVKLRGNGSLENQESAKFISKLFDFRKTVEMRLPKYKIGLKTTRKIDVHQRIKINMEGLGVFHTQVVENLRKYLAISHPEGPDLPPGFSWAGQRLNLYFWRQDDAGYVFETRVLDDFIDRKYPILHIAHSDNLMRSQKRNSIRVEIDNPAFLYPLSSINNANDKIEDSRGLKCRLRDLSEDGAAVLIGGRAKVGLATKIQFTINKRTIPMCGVVRGISFNAQKNQSLLHIQAVPLQDQIRNHVLSFVYNIFEEREEKPKGTRVAAYGT